MTDAQYFEAQFGVSQGMLRRVLTEAMARGGDFADLYFQHRTALEVAVQDHSVNRATTSAALGVGVRVVQAEQTGYAYTESLTEQAMCEAARTAAVIARGPAAHPPVALQSRVLPSCYDVGYDWGQVQLAEVMPLLKRVDHLMSGAHPAVRRVNVGFSCSQSRVMVVDSAGRVAADSRPLSRLGLSVTMERAGQLQSNAASRAGRVGLAFFDDACVQGLVQQVVERTVVLFDARKPSVGEMPLVLAAGASGILLHEAIGHGLEGDSNRIGTSIFSGRCGQRVATPEVTIVDSGLTRDLRGAINMDCEGVPGQETVLVQAGVLEGYLHDRISAAHYGVEPTGNGRRQSFRYPPLPRMRSTFMRSGNHTPEEVIRSVRKGIYAVGFTNGQVRIGPGDYTFYVKNGYLIEDGRLTAPIKDVNIIGNGPESLSRISMVGNDTQMDQGGYTCGKQGQRVPVSVGMPTVRVDAVTVGGVV